MLVRLTSDNPAAQEALRASLPELRAALAAQGLTASSLEVGDGQAQPRQDQAQPRQDQAQPERALNNTRAVPQQHTPAVVLPRLAGVAAGLDLRL
ncbi:MAG: flagellar hook-length control protein FliK [Frankiales bacterium]|nr:flagellar hook-length control protein FliK [Frankiales bacterium]